MDVPPSKKPPGYGKNPFAASILLTLPAKSKDFLPVKLGFKILQFALLLTFFSCIRNYLHL